MKAGEVVIVAPFDGSPAERPVFAQGKSFCRLTAKILRGSRWKRWWGA